MNSPLYPNQPCVEVATEVRFKGELKVENFRSEFQKLVREKYGALRVPAAKEGVAPALQPYRFESENGESGIQLAINSFSYYSREYPGHTAFLESAAENLEKFLNLIGEVAVTRVGWRYINAIPFTRKDGYLPLNKFFQDSQVFGSCLGGHLLDVDFVAVVKKDDIQTRISLKATETKNRPGEEALILDIDSYFSEPNPTIKSGAKQIFEHIEAVHNASSNMFRSLISGEYEAFLKGGDDG